MKSQRIQLILNAELHGERFLVFQQTKRGKRFICFAERIQINKILDKNQIEILNKGQNFAFEVSRKKVKIVFQDEFL